MFALVNSSNRYLCLSRNVLPFTEVNVEVRYMPVTHQRSYSVTQMVQVAHVLNLGFKVVKITCLKVPLILILKHRRVQIDRFHFMHWDAYLVAICSFIHKFAIKPLRGISSLIGIKLILFLAGCR